MGAARARACIAPPCTHHPSPHLRSLNTHSPPPSPLPSFPSSAADATRTPAAEGTAPLDLYSVTQGRDLTAAGVKDQTLTSRLWNLDRMDQRDLPLDGNFYYGTGEGAGAGGRGAGQSSSVAAPG